MSVSATKLTEFYIDRRRPAGPQIYEAIRIEIILENLKPGAPLNENDVCEWLDVSRTPVREAYQRLLGDGLIQVRSKVGTIVAEIDQARVVEGIVIRRALECEVVDLLCQKQLDFMVIDEIIALQSVCVSHGDQVGFFKRDEEFHAALAELAGLPAAWRVAQSVKAHVDRARIALNKRNPERINIAFQQHLKIVEALKTQDVELAKTLTIQHINSALDQTNHDNEVNP